MYFKAFALSGRRAKCCLYPGCCPGLGASALSGRVGHSLCLSGRVGHSLCLSGRMGRSLCFLHCLCYFFLVQKLLENQGGEPAFVK